MGSIPVHAAVKPWAGLSEDPTFLVHVASLPITMGLAVFSTGADHNEVPTTVSAHAFLERHILLFIYTHIIMPMCHS